MELTFSEHLTHRAQLHPGRAAIIVPGRTHTYAELESDSTRTARWLVADGVQPGDRVAIHCHNSYEAIRLFHAVFKAGAVAVPVNTRMKAPEIAYVLDHSGATRYFCAPALAPLARDAAALSALAPEVVDVVPASGVEVALPDGSPETLVAILYTSGTTAKPKGVCFTLTTALAFCRWAETDMIGGENAVGLCTTSLMHVAGMFITLACIYSGATAVILHAFDPAVALDALERYRCTFLFSLPVFLHVLVEEQARQPRDASSLRSSLAGGDSIPLALQAAFQQHFGLPLQEGYGMTEAGILAINPLDGRHGSMGLPTTGTELRIADADGRELPSGETGEIVVRTPVCTPGYWNDPDATHALYNPDGWLRTGDLGCLDADGYLWFRGRVKQIIVKGGSNISPQEVESALTSHPAVRQAGVVGSPDPVYGEKIVAFVSLRTGVATAEAELREFARKQIADYKTPDRIVFLDELPMGLTGKIDRRALKERLAA